MTPSPDIPEKEIRQKCTTFLSQSADEARRLGHSYIGTEHLFIAVTRNDCTTSQLLRRAGFDPRQVRNEIRTNRLKLKAQGTIFETLRRDADGFRYLTR